MSWLWPWQKSTGVPTCTCPRKRRSRSAPLSFDSNRPLPIHNVSLLDVPAPSDLAPHPGSGRLDRRDDVSLVCAGSAGEKEERDPRVHVNISIRRATISNRRVARDRYSSEYGTDAASWKRNFHNRHNAVAAYTFRQGRPRRSSPFAHLRPRSLARAANQSEQCDTRPCADNMGADPFTNLPLGSTACTGRGAGSASCSRRPRAVIARSILSPFATAGF